MEELAKIFIGEWGWMFVAGVFALAFTECGRNQNLPI